MSMNDPQELFLHELGDILYAERQLLKALPKMATETGDTELRESLERHEAETRDQISNVEQAFALMGEKAKPQKCAGIEGILKEHKDFVADEKPTAAVLNVFLTGAVLRAEHYEIAAYMSLVAQARSLGESKVATLLRKNLAQEKAMARTVAKMGTQLVTSGA